MKHPFRRGDCPELPVKAEGEPRQGWRQDLREYRSWKRLARRGALFPYMKKTGMFRTTLRGTDQAAVCVALASDGYPEHYEKGFPITGFDAFKGKDDYFCFHAGTKFEGDAIVTNGGRVLGITALGRDVAEARSKAYCKAVFASPTR